MSGNSNLNMSKHICFNQGFMCTLHGHQAYVNSVCVTSNGNYIISCSDDRSIIVWKRNIESITLEYKVDGHTDNVVSVYAIPMSEQFISGSYDSTINRWDISKNLQNLKRIHSDSTDPSILTVFCIAEGGNPSNVTIFKGSMSNTIIGYNETGDICCTLSGHTNFVRCLCSTSDGKFLISGSLDKTIRIWNWRQQVPYGSELEGHQDWVRCVCITHDDTRIVSGSNDETIRVWDIFNGFNIMTITGHKAVIRTVCMSGDGTQIISGGQDRKIWLWDLDTGAAVRVIEGHDDWVTSVCAIPHTSLIVSASSDRTVRIWNISASPLLTKYDSRVKSPIHAVACVNNERRFISASDQYLTLWDERSISEIYSTHDDVNGKITCMYIVPESSIIITGSNKFFVTLWILENNCFEILRKYSGHTDLINSIYCTKNEIISGSKDCSVRIWKNILNRNQNGYGNANANGGYISYIHKSAVLAVTILEKENQEVLYVSSSEDKMVYVCDSYGSFLVNIEGHTYIVRALSTAYDCKYLLTGSNDYLIKSWDICADVIKDAQLKVIPIRKPYQVFIGHTGNINAICCYSRKHYMMSASEDKKIIIWDLKQGSKLRTLCGHETSVTCLCISSVNVLISGSSDGWIRSWDLSVRRNLPSNAELHDLIISNHKDKRYEEVMKIIEGFRCSGLIKTFNMKEDMCLPHWLGSRDQLMYRDFLLHKLLNKYPEVLFAYCKCHKNLLRQALDSKDLRYAAQILRIFSSLDSKKFLSLASRDNYAMKRDLADHLLIDIEDLAEAIELLWTLSSMNNLLNGIFSLQCGPGAPLQVKLNLIADNLAHSESMFVIGSDYLLKQDIVKNIKNNNGLLADMKYAPFYMRECKRKPKMHSSTRFIKACVYACHKTGKVSLFKSNVLRALLDHKWNTYGFYYFIISIFYNFSIIIHFGVYSVMRPKLRSLSYDNYHFNGRLMDWYIHFLWPLILVVHTLPFLFVECTLGLISTSSNKFQLIIVVLTFLAIYVAIGMGYAEVDPDATAMISATAFLIQWFTFIYSWRCFPARGLFVRMIAQVLRHMGDFILLLVFYVFGFGYSMYLLFYNLSDSPYKYENDIISTHGNRFRTILASSMSMFFTMTGGSDWSVEEFIVTPPYIAATIFYIVFAYISIVLLNITIAMMSRIHDKVMDKVSVLSYCRLEYVGVEAESISINMIFHHLSLYDFVTSYVLCTTQVQESYRLEQAKLLVEVEALLIFFGWLNIKKDKVTFPPWMQVLEPTQLEEEETLK